MSNNLQLIVGLGNPGKQYEQTRHNAGFLVIDKLAETLGASDFKFNKKFNAEIAEINNNGDKLILVKPQTFMNNSGQAVRAIMDYYKLLPKTLKIIKQKNTDLSDQLIVIHDDVDFELSNYKIQTNRSAGGHNGVQSIIDYLKTQNFTRVRIGVNSGVKNNLPTDKFVLGNFSAVEIKKLEKIMPEIISEIIK